MTKKYFPTLIIGAGGTGTKVVRFIQSLADSGKHPDLKEMLETGAMQLVAIDTDGKSNQEEVLIDTTMAKSHDDDDERLPSKLSKLPKNWLHLNREDINQAVVRVQEPTGVEHQDDGEEKPKYPLAKMREWFPLRNEKTKDGITLGHSKTAGAAQWRPLGRMALFMNASRIYESLQKVFKDVQQADPEQGPVRAFIVCSLAGGTGSGMFWDLAFFLQMIDPGTQTSGMFLLGDPFEGVDEGGRIFPNIYAALKEMAAFKNWRKPFDVDYPIGAGLKFKGQQNGPLAFDMIYLYQSFPPGKEVTDRAVATIDMSCFRMAQNLLALCRRDLHAILDVGANNMDSDTTAMASAPEAGYCFSTTGTTLFAMHHSRDIRDEIFQRLIRELRPAPFGLTPPLSLAELKEQLACDVQNPLSQFLDEQRDLLKRHVPPEIQTWIRQLDDAIERKRTNPADSFEKLVEGLDPVLAQALERAEDGDDIRCGDQSEKLLATLQERLDRVWQEFRERIKKMPSSLAKDALALLTQWSETLGEKRSVSSGKMEIVLSRPWALSKFTQKELKGSQSFLVSLFNMATGGDQLLKDRQDASVGVLMQLRESLADFRISESECIDPLINRMWNDRHEAWKEQVDAQIEKVRTLEMEQRQRLEHDGTIQSTFERSFTEGKQPDAGHLHEYLKVCVPPDYGVSRNEWIKGHVIFLIERMQTAINEGRHKDEERALPAERVKEALEHMAVAYQTQSMNEAKTLDLIPLLAFVFELIDGETARAGIRNAKEAQILIDLANRVSSAITDYWQSKGNLVIQQAGGEEGLRSRLLRCRSKLFSSGVIENKVNKRHLIVLPFSEGSINYTREERRHIKETFEIMAQEVMHTKSRVSSETTDSPVIFFNDLFRSAEEITRINDYFKAYQAFGKEGKASFYHIHRDLALNLPEVVGQAYDLLPVLCGNPDCVKNLRQVARTEVNCPGCGNPIWNRCGNASCAEDSLRERLIPKKGDGKKVQIPFQCPSCEQELKTYWWRCPDECHTQRIPSDKETCPECLLEYHEKRRVYKEVHQRPDLRHKVCAGCMTIENEERNRTKIPLSLNYYYQNGVNGHDSLRFVELVKQYKDHAITSHLCGNGMHEHFLFPTCPVGKDDPKTRHHLYQRKGVFGCTKHPQLKFYLCHNCGYPVGEKNGKCQGCPRCTKPVKKCDYCSEREHTLYEPLPGLDPARCPNCKNPMDRNCPAQEEILHSGLKEPAFCVNIYGCSAGSDPWHTASEYDLERCRVCPDPASPLFPRSDLVKIVRDCPLCSVVLSPVVENNKERYISGRNLLDWYCKVPDIEDALNKTCFMCGARAKDILKWMWDSGFLLKLKHPRAQKEQALVEEPSPSRQAEVERILKGVTLDFIEDVSFRDALEILITLRENHDDQAAFSAIKRSMEMHDFLNWRPSQKEAILQLFPRQSAFATVLRKRLNGLWQKQSELKARTEQWVTGKN